MLVQWCSGRLGTMPFSPFRLLLQIFFFAILIAAVQVGLLVIAFEKLGLSPFSGMLLLMSALLGSFINLPLVRIRAHLLPSLPQADRAGFWRVKQQPFDGTTLIALNVGGCVIPVLFSLYLLIQTPPALLEVALATSVVTVVSYAFSRPVTGIGIAMPMFIAPFTAAAAALLINAEHSAPLAYIGGTLGVLLGADILRIRNASTLGAPVASIGGAGTFDGIFMTGIVAALLA